MEIFAKSLIGKPIHSLTQKLPLARVINLFVDPKNGKVFGVLARSPGLFGQSFYIDFDQVLNIFKDAILIKTPESLWDPKEIVRADQMMKSNAFIINSRVYDEEKHYLGKCIDFKISPLGFLESLFVRQFTNLRIISQTKIVRILPGKIIVSGFEKIKEKAYAKSQAKVALNK